MTIRAADVLTRCPCNPILTPLMMPFECTAVYNAGATRFGDRTLLLLRCEDAARDNSFHVATSTDGSTFTVAAEALRYPLRSIETPGQVLHCDPRITWFAEDNCYYICETVYLHGLGGVGIGMLRTRDFNTVEVLPTLTLPSNRNGFLFPERIGGLYVRLERPEAHGGIWLTRSPDLRYWGDVQVLDLPRPPWASQKIGSGTCPIRTREGWLIIYHGVYQVGSTANYLLGAALLDLEDPARVIAAPEEAILAPELPYERNGIVPNVVYTTGAAVDEAGNLALYYGGADTVVGLATTTVERLLAFCLQAKR